MDSIKLEEKSDDEMPQLERMEYCQEYPEEIKLEEPDIDLEWQEVKAELLEDDGFKQELVVPKEEEPDDYQDYRQLDPSDDWDNSLADPMQNRQVYRKCHLCSRLMSIELMTKTELNDSKMFLLVGMILEGKMLMGEAQLIFSEPTINACHAHFSEAVNKIFVFLGIRNIDQMRTCTKANILELMEIVVALTPSTISFGDFYYLLSDFIQRFLFPRARIFGPKKKLRSNTNQQSNGNLDSNRPVPRQVPFNLLPKPEFQPAWIPDSRPRPPMPRQMSSYLCSPKSNKEIDGNCFISSTEGSALQHRISKQPSALAPTGSDSQYVVPPVFIVQKTLHVARGGLPPILPHVKVYNKKCAVCHKIPGDNKIMTTRSRDRKLVLFVGLVIGLQKSIEEARVLCSRYDFCFCKTHLKDAMDAILKFLRIECISQMHLCSMDKKEKLMIVVHWMNPQLSYAGFFNVLNYSIQ